MSSGRVVEGLGRREMLLGTLSLASGCAGNAGFSSNDLVVIADAQRLVGDLRSALDEILEVVVQQDKGVDSRIRACFSSLEVAADAIDRAATLKPSELLSLLEPFSRNYRSLVEELDAEGLRTASGTLSADPTVRVRAPDEMVQYIRERVKAGLARA